MPRIALAGAAFLLGAGSLGAQQLAVSPLSYADSVLLSTGVPISTATASRSAFFVAREATETSARGVPAELAGVREAERTTQGAFSRRSVISTLGGAVIGAGLGYFASQVVKSDWEDGDAGAESRQRSQYAFAGAAIGAVGGFTIGRVGGRAPSPGGPSRPAPDGRNVITLAEIREASANNVYELIQIRRRNWLNERGVDAFRETPRGEQVGRAVVVTKGDDAIIVYLDNARLGGPERLREVPTAGIASIQYFDPTQATFKYGAGHSHGAILVSTKLLE